MRDARHWVTADPSGLADDPEYWAWRFERDEGYRQLATRLRTQGWTLVTVSEPDPVLLRGMLPTGEPFVLECRGTTCQLSDWPPGQGLFAEVSRWPAPQAGWIEAEEAEMVLQELVALARYDACLISDRGLLSDRGDEETLKDPSEASSRRRRFITLKRQLLAEGFLRVIVETEQQPIQLLGNLPSGEAFFLWCRWDTCLLNVGPSSSTLTQVISHPAWYGAIRRWAAPTADFLGTEEVRAVLEELIQRYRAEATGEGAAL